MIRSIMKDKKNVISSFGHKALISHDAVSTYFANFK